MTDNNTKQNEMLNNPLHGLKLEQLLAELVDHYGWEILAEYTRIKCFEKNVSMASSLKFLRKTEWAREKMERFYLYYFKNLPKADDTNFELPPRKRIIPAHQKPRAPAVLILGEAPEPKVRGARNNTDNNSRRKNYRKPNDNRRTSPYKKATKQTIYDDTASKQSDNNETDNTTERSTKVDPWANHR
jgi:uncharacterized protein (DUF2132 family)